jgi:serine/threonine-protein kinase
VARDGDDFAHGDTAAVDRSLEHAKAAPQPTMTMTPVRENPRSATPRPRGVMDDDDGPSAPTDQFRPSAGTEQMPQFQPSPRANTDEMPAARPSTEQMPAYKPGAAVRAPMAGEPKPKTEPYRPPSRRLEPIVVAEPSQVAPKPAEPPPEESAPSASVSETETAAPEELPSAPKPSRTPMIAVAAVVVLGVLGTVGYFATRPAEQPPTEIATTNPKAIEVRPPVVIPPPVAAAEDAGTTVAVADRPDKAGPAPAQEEALDAGAPVAGTATGDGPGPASKPRPMGLLTVRAVPYAEVIVDGKKRADAEGVKDIRIEAGTHDVVLRHNKKTKKQRVTVKPGQTVKLEFDANEP